MKKLTGKCLYFCDPMGNAEVELRIYQGEMNREGIDASCITIVENPPFDDQFDILLFDWGGMMIGCGGLMDSFCRQIIEKAENCPNTYFIMASCFTKEAMKDALDVLGKEKVESLHNIFLDIPAFCEFYKKYDV